MNHLGNQAERLPINICRPKKDTNAPSIDFNPKEGTGMALIRDSIIRGIP